ncbi:hypothetical protein [Lentzea aerocolonigenes]|uniref:hypothetical protein n=1 Tax=Lentzea aerocolonigenes TaxID=68170 RepID=UPI0004C40D76|nr:hypothetical protein [Lentzea aerocolonigenes]MCP2241321.1 hypothetical protein [Lentzea aerocolonigenes]
MIGTSPSGLATQIACAFAEEFFGFPEDGCRAVPVDAAALIAAGLVHRWHGWSAQSADIRQLMGRFLRVRPNEIGAPRRFHAAVRLMCADPDSPYRTDDGSPVVMARHGQRPLELVARLLDDAEVKYAQGRTPVPVAGEGRWQFGWRGESVVDLPAWVNDVTIDPVVVATASAVKDVPVAREQLRQLAQRITEWHKHEPWRVERLDELFKGLQDNEGAAVTKLFLEPGGIRLLNAPTGVGKSVLMRLLALQLADDGVPVVLVVGKVNEAVETAEKINEDLPVLGKPVSCTALVSPRRLAEKAEQAADRGNWERFDTLGYGCTLAGLMVDGPHPLAGEEPCTGLRRVCDATDSKGKRKPQPRHACPFLGACGRHRGLSAAASADIVVTNHHNFVAGTIPVPVHVDGVELSRLPVREFVLRRGAVVLVDEVDLLQSNMFDAGARQLRLSASGTAVELPLVRLDTDRSALLPAEDRAVVPPLTRTRFLADQFLNYVLEGDLWLGDERPQARRSSDGADSGWHLPGSRDQLLLQHLFGVRPATEDESAEPVPDEVYKQFNQVFPDTAKPGGEKLPAWLRNVADLLVTAVSNDSGEDHLREIRHRLLETVARKVKNDETCRDVVNALLVRTWLGALHQALTGLTFAVAAPGTEMPAARELAEQLGTVTQHQPIPYGPLGYLLFGFRVERVDDPRLGGTLSVQAVGGDPHTTVAQLGGTVALAAAGVERVVLGLSATAYFPGAAREHVLARVTYAMTDAEPGAFTTRSGRTLDAMKDPIKIGGRKESGKDAAVRELGAQLWDQHLDKHLRKLAEERSDRERCMLVGNSYRHAALLAAGVASKTPDHSWVAVLVSKNSGTSPVVLPSGVVTLTIDDLELLPTRHPQVKVCVAPMSLVTRGLNILVPGGQKSALASVWVCVRPPTQITDSAEMFASVNAHALRGGGPSADPVGEWAEQRRRAFSRLFHILTSDPRFSRLSKPLKSEAVAGMLVDMIQLAGRARRGGTPVQLFLVDDAFHDEKLGTDMRRLLRYYYDNLSPVEQDELRRIYGSTLESWLEFAGIDGKASS